MKVLALRTPEEMLDWVRSKAAQETIARNQRVSMNTLILEILKREMDADQKKGA